MASFIALSSCSKKEQKPNTDGPQSPVIESIQPNKGYPGDTVTITGKNYSTSITDNLVEFGQTDATVIAATSTQLKVKVPTGGTTAPISIKVKTSDFVASTFNFTYLQTVTIANFSPATAAPGKTITITGAHFSTVATENVVTFNGKPATVQTATETQLTVTVPQGANNGFIKVTTNKRTAISSQIFGVLVLPVTTLPASLNWQQVSTPSTMTDLVSTAVVDSTIVFFNTGTLDFSNPQTTFASKWHNLYTIKNGVITDVYNSLPGGGGDIMRVTNSVTDFYVITSIGIFRSADGLTWTKLLPYPQFPNTAFSGVTIKDDQLVVYEKANNAYVSTDNGTTWSPHSATAPGESTGGVGAVYYTSLASNNYFYNVPAFPTAQQFNYSTDGFRYVSGSGSTGFYYFLYGFWDCLAASGDNVFFVYAPSTYYDITPDHLRLYKSTDRGNTWSAVSGENVYTVKSLGDYVMYGKDNVYLSINNGNAFTKYAIPAGSIVSSMQIAGSYVYIFCKNGSDHKIYRAKLQ